LFQRSNIPLFQANGFTLGAADPLSVHFSIFSSLF
jgi:hypothetical protein